MIRIVAFFALVAIFLISVANGFKFDGKRQTRAPTRKEFWPFDQQVASTGVPLIDAALGKNEGLVLEYLTADKNSINSKDSNGSNALHLIAKLGHYKFPPNEIPKLLVDSGIDLNAVDARGQTPLVISLLSGWQKIAALLLDSGADRTVVTADVKQRITCPDCKRIVKQYNL